MSIFLLIHQSNAISIPISIGVFRELARKAATKIHLEEKMDRNGKDRSETEQRWETPVI